MRVKFWGTRGSLPVAHSSRALRAKLSTALTQALDRGLDDPADSPRFIDEVLPFPVSHTFGGNSSCVQIITGDEEELVCDLGSGARELAVDILARHGAGTGRTYHVLVSHMHWDHVMGFPYFIPAYLPGNRIHIHGCHQVLEQAFRRQHGEPGFPVPFDALGAEISFHRLEPGRGYDIAGCRVTPMRQHHSGGSFGYRIERDGKAVVYSTDSEHKQEDRAAMERVVSFFRKADLVIFDAMYSLADAVTMKEDWGHSSNVVGVELCQRAEARHLCLFHHEPANDDETLYKLLLETRRYEELSRTGVPLAISSAYDGLEIVP